MPKRKLSRMTPEEYWEWRSWKARRIRWEELVLALAVLLAFGLIVSAGVIFK